MIPFFASTYPFARNFFLVFYRERKAVLAKFKSGRL